MQNQADVPELTRLQRAKFVHEIQAYLRPAAGTLHTGGIDITQMQYDGRSLFIGIDANRPPDRTLEMRERTVRTILATRWPKLEIGFRPVEMDQ
ncbi:MAG TPA: hypothetical protein VLC93_09980, partial [Myxococcota bacterium]|nr:hypothetical protein [Myxococcota bacterium]